MNEFKLKAPYKPTGDQPQAIAELVKGFKEGNQCQTLLGVTGSGKTQMCIRDRFGIVQVGLSLKSHDPSQRANGFLTLAGGVIITFAKEILNLITG